MGLTAKLGYFKFLNKKNKKQILHAIDQVGMLEYAYRNIGDLSGGQQQRVFIARALVSEPDLLILDEPTVGIDFKNVERFYQLLDKVHTAQNMSLLPTAASTRPMTIHLTNIVCLNQTMNFHGRPEAY